MNKHKKIVIPGEEEVAAYSGSGAGSAQREPSAESTGAAVSSEQSGQAVGATSETDEWREKLLRAKAELANYQKRVEKDRSDAVRYAHAEMARALLPIVDDLDRLINSAADSNASLDALVQGVRLSRDNFLKILHQFHVVPIEAQGQLFDPNVHEALMEQPSDHPERTVLQEVARGYKLHDRVLRPSKVIVSKVTAVSADQGSE